MLFLKEFIRHVWHISSIQIEVKTGIICVSVGFQLPWNILKGWSIENSYSCAYDRSLFVSFVSALIRVISYKVGGNIRDLGMRIIVLGVRLFLEALRNYHLSDWVYFLSVFLGHFHKFRPPIIVLSYFCFCMISVVTFDTQLLTNFLYT